MIPVPSSNNLVLEYKSTESKEKTRSKSIQKPQPSKLDIGRFMSDCYSKGLTSEQSREKFKRAIKVSAKTDAPLSEASKYNSVIEELQIKQDCLKKKKLAIAFLDSLRESNENALKQIKICEQIRDALLGKLPILDTESLSRKLTILNMDIKFFQWRIKFNKEILKTYDS